MPRLSIDVSPQEHRQLKALAALKGVSIKEFVLRRILGDVPNISNTNEAEALAALMNVLEPRIEQARNGKTVRIDEGDLLARIKAKTL